jgi:hypothetical protein
VGGILAPLVVGAVLTATRADPEWLFIGLPFMGITWVASLYAPRGYVLTPEGLRIERRAGDLVVPYAAVLGVDRDRRGLACFGAASNGFLGWYTFGRAWRPGSGPYRLALTNRRDVVWLRTTRGWIAISPDPPDAFVDRLRERLASRSGTIRRR